MRWLRELTKPNVVHLNSSMQAAADLLNREQNVFMAFVKVKRSFDSFHIIFSGWFFFTIPSRDPVYQGKDTYAAELFADGTIGAHDEIVRAIVELHNDKEHAVDTSLLPPADLVNVPSGEEAIVILRKQTEPGGTGPPNFTWARLPLSLLKELRKTAIISLPGGGRGQQHQMGPGEGGGGQMMGGMEGQQMMGGMEGQQMMGGMEGQQMMGGMEGQQGGQSFQVPPEAMKFIDQQQGGQMGMQQGRWPMRVQTSWVRLGFRWFESRQLSVSCP